MFETLKNAFKVKEIRIKIYWTLLFLLLYRVGCPMEPVTADLHPSLRGGCEGGDHPHGCGLPRTIGSEESEDLPSAYVEINTIHGCEVAETLHKTMGTHDDIIRIGHLHYLPGT